MKQQKFRIAGWAAVIAAVAFAVEIVLSLLAETPAYGGAIGPGVVVLALAVHVLMGSFAMWRLREFLHETCDFHGVDALIPWVIGGENSNEGHGETVWRFEHIAKGEPEEQGETQLRATSDGSKALAKEVAKHILQAIGQHGTAR